MTLDWDSRLTSDTTIHCAYDQMLRGIGAVADGIGERPITEFFPAVGSAYRGTVIVGQAVWGWAGTHVAADYVDAEKRRVVVDEAKAVFRDHEDQMDWIDGWGRTRSQPFWKTGRLLAESLEPDLDAPWYARIAWTNLFPMAWQSPDPGSPHGALKDAQVPHAADLLWATLRVLEAKRVVIFGGEYWWPVRSQQPFDQLVDAERPLLSRGEIDGVRIVAGWHPNGARYRSWRPERYAELLTEELS